jgi:DNA-binding XRE family transcriptional regulator
MKNPSYNVQYNDQINALMVNGVIIMDKEKSSIPPSLRRLLGEIGGNIRLARLRRKFSTTLIAERAGISRNTLRAIENGESSASFGAYVMVLFCLGLEQDLKLIARDDELGRKLQDANLSVKARAPRRQP